MRGKAEPASVPVGSIEAGRAGKNRHGICVFKPAAPAVHYQESIMFIWDITYNLDCRFDHFLMIFNKFRPVYTTQVLSGHSIGDSIKFKFQDLGITGQYGGIIEYIKIGGIENVFLSRNRFKASGND